jgi:hypothetical protein
MTHFSETRAVKNNKMSRHPKNASSVGRLVSASAGQQNVSNGDVDSRMPPVGGRRWTDYAGGGPVVALMVVVHRDNDDLRHAPHV